MSRVEGQSIISVGIDIGTSTTKFIVSHLKYAKVWFITKS
ncbi:ethanolamine ammonia-lyase reactivating factor EutA, partial [Geobacillus kaustophilus]